MSMFSGKCDLYDHISGRGGWFNKEGKPVKFSDPDVHVLYSDEMLDFIAFKKQTGGVLHQHKVLTVTPWNLDEAMKLCPEFKAISHTRTVPDKRQKSGERTETYYTYIYWGKEYTSLKELNKKKVYITIDIKFDTLLDLIPYYPYIVTMACGGTVYISQQSYVDEELEDHLDGGWYSDFWQHYKKELQDHYREVVLRYFNPEGREHIEEIKFGENGIGYTMHPIDENFELEWRWADGKIHSHWTSPKVLDKSGMIQMSKEDLKYLGRKMLVYYVESKEHQLNLG